MKKKLLIAGGCSLAGLLLMIVAFIAARGNLAELSTRNVQAEHKEYECSTDIIKIDADITSDNLEIRTGDVEYISVSYYDRAGYNEYDSDRFIDTLIIARNMFPGARNSLDALCKRFNIDNSARTVHGALLDAELLADVYLQLSGGDEPSINFNKTDNNIVIGGEIIFGSEKILTPRDFNISEKENQAHIEFMEKHLKTPIWLRENKKDD